MVLQLFCTSPFPLILLESFIDPHEIKMKNSGPQSVDGHWETNPGRFENTLSLIA